MSEEKPGQYLTIRQDKSPGAFGKWSIPGLEQSFELDGGIVLSAISGGGTSFADAISIQILHILSLY